MIGIYRLRKILLVQQFTFSISTSSNNSSSSTWSVLFKNTMMFFTPTCLANRMCSLSTASDRLPPILPGSLHPSALSFRNHVLCQSACPGAVYVRIVPLVSVSYSTCAVLIVIPFSLLQRLVNLIVLRRLCFSALRQYCCDRCCQCRLAVVYVSYRSDVYVRFRSVVYLLCHLFFWFLWLLNASLRCIRILWCILIFRRLRRSVLLLRSICNRSAWTPLVFRTI